jgi:hypothetical protein
MPRIPINYANTLIYKLVCNDLNTTELYVGSTTDFTKRKNAHKSKCINELSKQHNFKVYQYIRANGGWSDWSMIEIEKFPCADSKEAKKRERYWIETLKAMLNCNIPSRTKSEWILANKEQIAEQKKIYNEANKERRHEKFDCPCGGKYCHGDKSRHLKCQKHLAYLANIQSPPLAI